MQLWDDTYVLRDRALPRDFSVCGVPIGSSASPARSSSLLPLPFTVPTTTLRLASVVQNLVEGRGNLIKCCFGSVVARNHKVPGSNPVFVAGGHRTLNRCALRPENIAPRSCKCYGFLSSKVEGLNPTIIITMGWLR